MKEMMRAIFKFQGVSNVVADELSVLPGMEEGAAFLWLEKFYREKTFDIIIIDSAPTGETLTLLSLPQVRRARHLSATHLHLTRALERPLMRRSLPQTARLKRDTCAVTFALSIGPPQLLRCGHSEAYPTQGAHHEQAYFNQRLTSW